MDFFSDINSSNSRLKSLLSQSSPAVCGLTEREVVVKTEDVAKTKAALKSKGFFIVGTSEPNGRTRKIWFSRSSLL